MLKIIFIAAWQKNKQKPSVSIQCYMGLSREEIYGYLTTFKIDN